MRKALLYLLFIILPCIGFAQQTEANPEKPILNKSEDFEPAYRGIIEIGHQFGIGEFGFDRIKLNFINGQQISPYIYFGIGTGLRRYYDVETSFVPVFADFRVNFSNKDFSPYFSLDFGYSFTVTNGLGAAGYLLNPALGMNVAISKHFAFHIGAGYEMQIADVTYNGFYRGQKNIGAIGIQAGFSF